MITVSNDFKNQIYSSNKMIGKIIFEIVPIGCKDDSTISVNNQSEISNYNQLTNSNIQMSYKYATLEKDFCKLDGTFGLPPIPGDTSYEVGWWSNNLCNSVRTFFIHPTITFNFTKSFSSIGITLNFDRINNQYSSRFNVYWYSPDGQVIDSLQVSNHNSSTYKLYRNVSNFNKIQIVFLSWSEPYRRLKLVEVDFGVVEDYGNDEIIKMNILEEVDLTSKTIPSNEIHFDIENQDKRFNILNPTGIYPYLQKRQRVIPFLGLEKDDGQVEYIKMGTYYLSEWESKEGDLIASFKARDLLDILGNSKFSGNTYNSTTLYDITVEVLQSAGITDYYIDVLLNDVITSGLLSSDSSHKECLQTVAIAGRCILYVNRENKLILKRYTQIDLNEVISFDNLFDPPDTSLDTGVNTVYIKIGDNTYSYTSPDKTSDEPIVSVELSNDLITDTELAESVANWLLDIYSKKYLYEFNWRQNPIFELGDSVVVEDSYNVDKNVIITKNEFDYNGYLEGTTNGRAE